MDDLGVPPFQETSIHIYIYIYTWIFIEHFFLLIAVLLCYSAQMGIKCEIHKKMLNSMVGPKGFPRYITQSLHHPLIQFVAPGHWSLLTGLCCV